MFEFGVPAWQIIVRSLVVYAVLFVGLRLSGKREVGQFTLFDLVMILLVANAVQPAMTGPDTSLGGGLVIIGVLLAGNFAVAQLRLRSALGRRLLEGHPTVLAQDGHWLDSALRREALDVADCEMALREHGIADVREVQLAVLEADGTISVVPVASPMMRGRQHLRTRWRR